jgi:type II secretory pathway component GspD/PulD (secretin)
MFSNKNMKNKISKVIIIWALATFAMAALVIGQVEPADDLFVVLNKTSDLPQQQLLAKADNNVQKQKPELKKKSISDYSSHEKEMLNGHAVQSIEFSQNMTILEALRFLAITYQKNIVPSPGIEGNVTFTNLYNVTFEEALQAVLGPNEYAVEGNFIKVYTPEEFTGNKSRMIHEVIVLNFITAAEAQNLISPLMSDAGTLAVTSATEADTEPGKGGDSMSGRDRLVISDFPERMEKIREVLDEVDSMPPQVLIEVTILEATLNEQTEFGIDFDILGLTTATPGTVALGDDAISVGGFASGVTSGGLSVGIVKDHVRVFIRALEGITDTTVLANPKILALNKQAGKVKIAREDGYTTTTNADGVVTESVEFLESGTLLQFRPFVADNGMIRMEIYPEQSSGEINDSGLPEKSTTEVMTNIMVKDGKTVVIGGLFKEKTVLSRKQVPVVGDMPLIGQLAKKTDDTSVRTELIVLITPHVIYDPEKTNGDKRLADVKRLAQKARNNITWLSRARRAEDRYAKAVELYSEGKLDKALSHLNWTFESERPFLEAIKLKEQIIRETDPRAYNRLERIMLDKIEQEEKDVWLRR